MAKATSLVTSERNVGVVGARARGILTGQHRIGAALQPRPHAQQLDEQPDDDNRKRHDEADRRMARHQGDEDAYGQQRF